MRRAQILSKSVVGAGLAVTLWGCGAATETSSTKVTNGREVAEGEFPSVVLLFDQTAGAICTGTFITPTVVLTAAHCSMSGKVNSQGEVDLKLAIVNIKDQAKKEAEVVAVSTKVVRNPLWDKNGGNVNSYDLGLVTFEPGVAQAVSEIAPQRAKVGDRLEIVGYGLNQATNLKDPSSAGVKRTGTNKVVSLSQGFIQFDGANNTSKADGTNSSASSGDSGGPLFIDGKVAGVTSGGGWGGFFKTRSLYIDLYSPQSQEFLAKYLD